MFISYYYIQGRRLHVTREQCSLTQVKLNESVFTISDLTVLSQLAFIPKAVFTRPSCQNWAESVFGDVAAFLSCVQTVTVRVSGYINDKNC